MSRAPLHALTWSAEQSLYELYTQGQLEQRFRSAEEAAWLAWLRGVSSFAFHGSSGSLNVYREQRPRGGTYWYAYHTSGGRTRKRYLGRMEHLSLTQLEETARVLSPAQALDQGITLLSGSLAPPPLPASLLERESLLIRLDAALTHPLTLVSAAAGWGKTTLLSAWVSRCKAQIAWLSLSELDNSPTRFWVGLIAALRRGVPTFLGLGQTAMELLQSPQPPELSTILTTLLNELASHQAPPAPLVLMVDDYHVIDEPAIHEGMSFFLEHLPASVHLILSSRVDPDLPLSRLRVRGQLAEIREADLRLSLEEASQYLGWMLSPMLSAEEVHQLVSRTEGWIAGLHLAALALRQRTDRTAFLQAFSGSQRYLLDYIQEEILAPLSAPARDFLLHSAILSRLDAAACQAVTAAQTRAVSQQMLEWLEQANLFVVPLDEERRSYRLHELFREALLVRLHTSHPELVPLLHHRAARFYEAQEAWAEAIAHALAAPDFPYAVRLMERAAPRCWVSGEAQTVQTWISTLPDAVLWPHARLALQATLRVLDSLFATTEASSARAQALVEQLVARLEALLRQQAKGADQPEELLVIGRHLRLLRALIEARALLRRGESARLAQLATELEGLSQEEDLSWQLIPLAIDFWLTEGFQHESALLIPRLLEVRQQAERAGDLLTSIRVRDWLTYAYLRTGAWPQVERECLAGLALLDQSGVRSASAGYWQCYLADAYYAWNRLEEAADAVHEMLRIAQDWQQIDLLIWGQLNVARVALARGVLSAADQALSQVEALVQHEPFANLASPVAAFRVQYWLAAGELEAARHWAEQVGFFLDPWDRNNKWAALMRVRVQLVQHQYLQALDLLERFRGPLNQPGDTLTAMEWLALHVVTLRQADKREEAQSATARLLALTEPTGAIRVYLDEGEPMKQALQSLLSSSSDQQEDEGALSCSYISRLLAAFEQEEHQRAGQAEDRPDRQDELAPLLREAATARAGEAASSAFLPLKPLTAQEQRVLRQLCAGRSTQEIAASLVVSVNTVKTHLKNLYSKLQVNSRTQATVVAHERQLL